ncbi:hypothetical protein [Flavobacterium humi]|uniref:ImmA/IrrE family metallo-endopeptidase n=1 Tax=Flavobacterium humi TaxID=2562683 RepID=A0A4Z0LCF1_9FLAO|nr:hypothetical protein [Flavobacterium humi]TGD59570.1 hypothetical protein E4635_01150 [Flavobacterium humi]
MTVELQKILAFLKEIGIRVIEKELDGTTFLPGLAIGPNYLIIDYQKLKYPGDILHEAGHLAVTPAAERKHIGTETMPEEWPTQGDEIGAMLWSYAASCHLELAFDVVFHPNGYKGNSDWLIDSYKNKNYIGLPFLEWAGLTLGQDSALKEDKEPFPAMQQWLRN